MKTMRPVISCNSCGHTALDEREFAEVKFILDGHVEYDTHLCRENCLGTIVAIGQRTTLEPEASFDEIVEHAKASELGHDEHAMDLNSDTTCVLCGRSFKSPNGLKVHVGRTHT